MYEAANYYFRTCVHIIHDYIYKSRIVIEHCDKQIIKYTLMQLSNSQA